MAGSKYEFVKEFEQTDNLLKEVFIVLRIDGRGFTKFSAAEKFDKPNDDAGLWLMASAALEVMKTFPDCVLSYGQSDEFSFIFKLSTTLFSRRGQKILSTGVSTFTAAYVRNWIIRKMRLSQEPPDSWNLPTFDGRIVLYPTLNLIKDYLSWRQVDCHINNLYNYCFWLKVKREISETTLRLMSEDQGNQRADTVSDDVRRKIHQTVYSEVIQTDSAQKNEILFQEFGVNYNNLPQLHRKGTVIWRTADSRTNDAPETSASQYSVENFAEDKAWVIDRRFVVSHTDIISGSFWRDHQGIVKKLIS